eukprot:scaffold29846_cov45-Phaeocystis_antarctica.AAC.1
MLLPSRLRARGKMENGERVGVSMGADTKANTREPVRATGGLLELFQRRVALQPVSESDSSLGAELVESQTARTGAEAGVE